MLDRNALCIYFKNIRDLELSRHRIKQMYDHEQADLRESELAFRPIEEREYQQYEAHTGCWIVGIVCSIIAIGWCIGMYNVGAIGSGFFWLGFLGYGSIAGFAFSAIVGDNKLVDEYNNKVRQENAELVQKNLERKTLLEQYTKESKERMDFLRGEYNYVSGLLRQAYALNIIPNQFRNLPAVYYIYDFMSSSLILCLHLQYHLNKFCYMNIWKMVYNE